MNVYQILDKQSRLYKIFMGIVLIASIGFIDLKTGVELDFSLFYIIPIFFCTLFLGRKSGLVTSILSTVVWFWANAVSDNAYSHPFYLIWNTIIRLSFFLIITWFLSEIKRMIDHVKDLSRTDSLTGAANSRYFNELLQIEIDRSIRYEHPFTLVYIDIDNFKTINDKFGHHTGDHVLTTVVSYAKSHLRKTDVIGRLGGDEFALLLPETNQELARFVVEKFQTGFLKEMKQNNWSISLSIGVLTCIGAAKSADELIQIADDIMYTVKHGSKNAIQYDTCSQ